MLEGLPGSLPLEDYQWPAHLEGIERNSVGGSKCGRQGSEEEGAKLDLRSRVDQEH
jgi:hypothetical protein